MYNSTSVLMKNCSAGLLAEKQLKVIFQFLNQLLFFQGYLQELMHDYLPEKINLVINHRMMSDIRRRYYKKFGLVDTEKKDSLKEKQNEYIFLFVSCNLSHLCIFKKRFCDSYFLYSFGDDIHFCFVFLLENKRYFLHIFIQEKVILVAV